MVTLLQFFVLSAVLLSIGVYGLVGKRNAVRMLFAVEIIVQAALINFVAFARFSTPPNVTGQTFTIFGIALAAAEIAVGLSIILLAFRVNQEIDVLELNRLKG